MQFWANHLFEAAILLLTEAETAHASYALLRGLMVNSSGKIIGYVNTTDMFTDPGQDQKVITIYKSPTGTETTGQTTKRGDPPMGGPAVAPIVTSP